MTIRSRSPLRALFVASLVAAIPSASTANPYAAYVDARVLTGWRESGTRHVAALELTLAEGWKTYWRAPGDAGVPPVLDWHQSDNIAGVSISWPTPEVIDQNGMTSIGYHGHVILPLRIDMETAQAGKLEGALHIGICKDICVPITLDLRAAIPATGTSDPRIHRALAAQPLSAKRAGAGKATCAVEVIDGGLRVTARLALPSTGAVEHAIIESRDPQVWVSEAVSRRSGGTLTATADLIHMTGAAFALDRAGLRFTVLGSERAVDIQGCSAE